MAHSGMRYGIISDIHGNLEALEAVLKAGSEKVSGWICLGDTVGYGPQPNECIDRVRELCEVTLIGNHDLAAIGLLDINWFNPYAREAAIWTQEALTEESIRFLEGLPETCVRDDWDVTFSHGSLTDPPRDYITSRSEARTNFKLLQTQALFIGHSHLSHSFSGRVGEDTCDEEVFHGRAHIDLVKGYHYIINCGSVGQPRDRDPRAAYGVLDIERRVVDVYRVKYDIESVQRKIEAAALPELLGERLSYGY